MNPRHLSDDELIGMLYGLGDSEKDAGHLAGCSECGERFSAMGRTRAAAVDAPQFSGRMLAAQRQRILERLERPLLGASRWVPLAGAASLLAAAMFVYHRPSVPAQAPPAVNAEADSQLFTDVYSMEQDVEPRAAAPIRSLFQETSLEKEDR